MYIAKAAYRLLAHAPPNGRVLAQQYHVELAGIDTQTRGNAYDDLAIHHNPAASPLINQRQTAPHYHQPHHRQPRRPHDAVNAAEKSNTPPPPPEDAPHRQLQAATRANRCATAPL